MSAKHFITGIVCLLAFCGSQVLSQPLAQKFTLGTPTGNRFTLTDFVWPANHGDAAACLWENDKLSAVTLTIDDNCAMNHDWWMAQGDTFGFKFTWFVITGPVNVTNTAMYGTWSKFRTLYARGHAVQSHSVAHGDTTTFKTIYGVADYTQHWYEYYYDAKRMVEDSIPGDKCYTLAPPGSGTNNTDSAALYYISMRGGVAYPQAANQIDFKNTRNSSAFDTNHVLSLVNKTTQIWGKNYRRGWACFLWHYVAPDSAHQTAAHNALQFIKDREDSLWVARYPDLVRYNMEYATQKLTKLEASDSLIRYALTDSMDDTIYTYPLTIKVRLNSDWQTVDATQNGAAIPCTLITNNGNRYARVKAVPDQGEIKLAKVGGTGLGPMKIRQIKTVATGVNVMIYNVFGHQPGNGKVNAQGIVSTDVTGGLSTGIYLFKAEGANKFEKRLIVK